MIKLLSGVLLCSFSALSLAFCPLHLAESVRVRLPVGLQGTDAQIILRDNSDGEPQLQWWNLSQGRMQAQLNLATAGVASAMHAQPMPEDVNLDGLADHLWLLSAEGLLWRLPLIASEFGQPRLMADLRDSGLVFSATAGLIRSRLPINIAPLAWRNTEQLQALLIGHDPATGHDTLLMLRFELNNHGALVTDYSQLMNRTLLSSAELKQHLTAGDWRAMLATAGWWVKFPGKISALPKVIAGVIYAPVVSTAAEECTTEPSEQQLFALQLHTAGTVYATRKWSIPHLASAELHLQLQADNGLTLVLHTEQQTLPLLNDLLKISSECHHCTEPLSFDRFPLWQRLATYRSEQGAF